MREAPGCALNCEAVFGPASEGDRVRDDAYAPVSACGSFQPTFLHFTDAARLNFRAEMYNVTNHTFFTVASTQVGNAAFGTVTTNSAYNRRAAQFSARLEF